MDSIDGFEESLVIDYPPLPIRRRMARVPPQEMTPYVGFPAMTPIAVDYDDGYRKPVIRDFPYCCTGVVMARLGESVAADGGDFPQDIHRLEGAIIREIDNMRRSGLAFISVTTNSQQPTANEVLKRLGFKYSKWMSKKIHPETRVRLWWMALN